VSPDARDASQALAEELGQRGPQVLPRIAAEYLEIRAAENALKRRRDAVRKQLLPLLEDAGGSYIDEDTGQRIYITQQMRWEWDAGALKTGLLDEHLITEGEFADCLVTSVNKDVVKGWVDKGAITDRQLARANAKVGTKVVQQIEVEAVGEPGRRALR